MLSGLTLSDCEFVAVDLETTGCTPGRNSIIEIGAVRLRGGHVVSEFSSLVRPTDPLPRAISQLTGITTEMLGAAPSVDEVVSAFRTFAAGAVLVAHNYRFDLGFLDYEAERLWGEPFPRPALDTLSMARRLHPGLPRYSLLHLAERFGATVRPDHRASHDAQAAAQVLQAMLPDLVRGGIVTVGELAAYCGLPHQQALASHLPLTRGMPDRPGVYLLIGQDSSVLYVGRAKNLRSRVRSHFYPVADPAHMDLGRSVEGVRSLTVDSPLDGALLEAKLISRYDPPFNHAAVRPRALFFLHIDTTAPFPTVRVLTVRRKRGVHLGPFTSRWAASVLADRLAEVYELRRCGHRLDSRLALRDCEHRGNGCPAPCVNDVDRLDYAGRARQALSVFDGGEADARARLEGLQSLAAGETRYEDAIRYRDALRALDRALGTLTTLRTASTHDAVLVETFEQGVSVHLVRSGLRAATLRGTAAEIDSRLARAIRRVYFSHASALDLQSLGPAKVAELLTIASFSSGDTHIEVPVTAEAATAVAVRRSLGLDRRRPRRRHAAS